MHKRDWALRCMGRYGTICPLAAKGKDEKMKICRRNFLKSGMMAAGALTGGGCAMVSGSAAGGKKFYKGQFHTHTWWSDGKAAPEQAVAFYKK